ncbi:MAG: tetratricopeptide repeat protein [Campylobacterota bacterium]
MNRYIIQLIIIASLANAQEVSVFGAGDLNSENPYGLNSAEKHILQNKKELNKLDSKINDVNSLLDSVKRRLEGIESIYEGDSSKLNSTVHKINKLVKKVEESKDLATKNKQEAQEIKSVSSQLISMKEETDKEVRQSISKLKEAISQISNLLNKVNRTYVSESELRKNMKQFITRDEFENLKNSIGNSSNKKSLSKSNETEDDSTELSLEDKKRLMKEAKKHYSTRYFKYAIPKFEKLIANNYKPAESNYYLGEMWYVRDKYDLAISHFKKSAMLNDKAAYMPSLLLHSAISFEKTNDKENAKSFYSTLIDLYPKSDEAKEAKNLIKKL